MTETNLMNKIRVHVVKYSFSKLVPTLQIEYLVTWICNFNKTSFMVYRACSFEIIVNTSMSQLYI